ncbi:MAG: holo-ACP synthase [Chromatiales bacterium]
MIYGIGVDMVRVSRMTDGFRRFGVRLPRRILNDAELNAFAACVRQPRFLAQRFAAKEAAAKALGTGFSRGVFPRDIVVVNDKRGKPLLSFAGHTLRLIRRLGITSSRVSLTDEGDYAIAMVTLERS